MAELNLLKHKKGRAVIALAFYFAEGVPIGFIWWAMPTLMRNHGAGIEVIGTFVSVLTLPWVLKFLWAPLIDVLRTPRFGFTHWIGLAQGMMCLTLIPLLFIPLEGNYYTWGVFLFLHSLFAATQDVSVDAMVINLVVPRERGMLNGYMQAGMLIGRSLFGGAALIFAGRAGLPLTIGLMIFSILCTMALLPFIKEGVVKKMARADYSRFQSLLVDAFRSKQTWFTLGFALTAAAAFETAGAFAGPFLTDRHADIESIGFFFSIPVVAAMILGGFTGGYLSDRMSRKSSVSLYLVGFVLTVGLIAFSGLMHFELSPAAWMAMFASVYFFTGMFTSSSYALFMDVTNPSLGATQFSTFMAATNACESWTVFTAGMLVAGYSYGLAFAVMCLVSLFSLVFLSRIRIPEQAAILDTTKK